MKRILLVLSFSLAASGINAQTSRFSGEVSVGTAIVFDKASVTPFSIQAAGFFRLSSRFSVGAGTGLHLYETPLIPLFGNVRFRLSRPRKFTPHLACAAGYAFAPSDKANGGLYLGPEIGVRWALKESLQLFLGIGYEMQRLERLKTHDGAHLRAAYCEQLRHNGISIKIGVAL